MPTAPAIRDKRQQAILKIIAARPVARQSEFVSLLVKDGYEATQSSVSRDLRELGITKLEQGYARSEPAGNSAANVDIPTDFVRDVLTAGTSLTVVKTATGAAQRVALFLDRSNWPEIVGTVSGDDTIFVATRNGKEQKQLLSRIRASLQA